jgi:hypothetical protein
MKSLRTTALLALGVGAVIGYTVYDSYREKAQDAAKTAKEKIADVAESDISLLKIVTKSESILLKRMDGNWQIIEPVKDQTDSETLSSFLSSLSTERATEVQTKAPIDWAKYHLNEPGAKFEIEKNDGAKLAWAVSSFTTFDGNYYLRVGDKLLLGTSSWGRLIGKTAAQLRDKRVLRNPGEVEAITISIMDKDNQSRLELKKREGHWVAAGQDKLALDEEKINRYIEDLKAIKAMEVLSGPVDQTMRKAHGFDGNTRRIGLTFKKQEGRQTNWSMEVGKETGGFLYAISSSVAAVFKLAAAEGGKILKTLGEFRDGKAPFRLAMDKASEVRVKTAKDTWTFKKQGDKWTVMPVAKDKVVNQESIKMLLEKLSALEAKEFLEQKQLGGDVRHEISLRDEKGQPMVSLGIGGKFKPKKGPNKDEDLTVVKSSLVDGTVGVPSFEVSQLGIDQLLKPVETKSSEKP